MATVKNYSTMMLKRMPIEMRIANTMLIETNWSTTTKTLIGTQRASAMAISRESQTQTVKMTVTQMRSAKLLSYSIPTKMMILILIMS